MPGNIRGGKPECLLINYEPFYTKQLEFCIYSVVALDWALKSIYHYLVLLFYSK